MIRVPGNMHLTLLWLLVLLSNCKTKDNKDHKTILNCDRQALESILTMPPLNADSSATKTFEALQGSQMRVPGFRPDRVFHTPKDINPPEPWRNSHALEVALGGRVNAERYESEASWAGGSADLIDDGLDVARLNKVWLPVFYRPAPIPALNMVVFYQMLDSTYGSDGWRIRHDRSVIKLYHRDAVLDTLFPELKATAPLAPRAIAPLFHCLHAHFDSLYGRDPSDKPRSLTTDLSDHPYQYIYEDKPFKDLIRHYAWLTPDSVAIELYCYAANYPGTYLVYDGGAHNFLFDSTSCTYRPVPSGTPGSLEWAFEIQWEDLAIWIVYTDLKRKQRAKYEP